MTSLKEFIELIPKPCSVAVITNYRTGSTALCDFLSNYLKIDNYDEVFHQQRNPAEYGRYKETEHGVLKIMQDQIVEPYWTDILNRFVIIGLYRKDLARQSASWYIANQIIYWHTQVGDVVPEYEIYFDIVRIKEHCKVIEDYNKMYQTHRQLFSREFAYEDIQHEFTSENTKYARYAKPTNYYEVLDVCQKYFYNR